MTHLYVQIYNLYLSHRKLYIRNLQPIYNTVQHIFSDTTYILVFNIFVTLGVPYHVEPVHNGKSNFLCEEFTT